MTLLVAWATINAAFSGNLFGADALYALLDRLSITAFVRFTGMAAPGPSGQGLARG